VLERTTSVLKTANDIITPIVTCIWCIEMGQAAVQDYHEGGFTNSVKTGASIAGNE